MLKLAAFMGVTLFLTSPALALQSQQDQIREVDTQTFADHDYDGNGWLDFSEYAVYAQFDANMNDIGMSGTFAALDADGNDLLSFEEFTSGICCG